MLTPTDDLTTTVARIERDGDPDPAAAALRLRWDGDGTVVSPEYLEPVLGRTRLDRSAAAAMLDLAARACVDARAGSDGLAALAAHRIRESGAHRRLGYRNDGDYAREQLGLTSRAFRDLARLGRRLAKLPRIRRALLSGRISRTRADVVAGVATPDDEAEWLERAVGGTVRSLKKAAREARAAAEEAEQTERAEQTKPTERTEQTKPTERTEQTEQTERTERAEQAEQTEQAERAEQTERAERAERTEQAEQSERAERAEQTEGTDEGTRLRLDLQVPEPIPGKVEAVLELAARVAGRRLPRGKLWEFVAAEYLSGLPQSLDGLDEAAPDGSGRPERDFDGSRGAEPDDGSCSTASRAGESWTGQTGSGSPGGAASARRELPSADHRAEQARSGAERPASDLLGWKSGHVPGHEPTVAGPRRRPCPEDPRGYKKCLEKESRCWQFLPRARSRVELGGPAARFAEHGEELAAGVEKLTPWQLHRRMTAALQQRRAVDWQLGRLAATIRNRRLWHDMLFSSFGHYVSERLGVSVRHVQRLIRVDRAAMESRALAPVWQAGELSVLQAELLARVLRCVGEEERETAWVDLATRSTHDRFAALVRSAERLSDEGRRCWWASGGDPGVAVARLQEEEEETARMWSQPAGDAAAFTADGRTPRDPAADDLGMEGPAVGDPAVRAAVAEPVPQSDATMFVTSKTSSEDGIEAPGAGPSVPAGSRITIWATRGEAEVISRALEEARAALERGTPAVLAPGRRRLEVPTWRCLNLLLDVFLASYGGEEARRLAEAYPICSRDGWQCRVPGCRSLGPLHVHHIVFRAHGGGDEPENLVTLCDFHHRALHDGWIRCAGQAPRRLYWELGVGPATGFTADGNAGARLDHQQQGLEPGVRDDASPGGRGQESPVAQFFGETRLAPGEYWDGREIRVVPDGGIAA